MIIRLKQIDKKIDIGEKNPKRTNEIMPMLTSNARQVNIKKTILMLLARA